MPLWYARPTARVWTCPPPPTAAAAFHAALPGYAPTPLTELPPLAAELAVGRVFVKDESSRLGLPAFKALGASWAVFVAVSEHFGVTVADPVADPAGLRRLLAGRTVELATATDGNHGRAVARAAAGLGLPATVYVPAVVHPAAVAAIRREGATVTVVDGSYDDAVALAAAGPGLLVQDTGWPGYERIPQAVVDGYGTLFTELSAQLDGEAAELGLLAVPMGVGSLAQAAVTAVRGRGSRAALLGVEPDTAAGVLASLHAGQPRTVPTGATVMAGLNCGTPSALAWPYLRDGLDAAVAVTDDAALRAAHDLAALGVPAGPSGAAALAGARAALTDPARRARLDVGPASTVVLLCTEGAAALGEP